MVSQSSSPIRIINWTKQLLAYCCTTCTDLVFFSHCLQIICTRISFWSPVKILPVHACFAYYFPHYTIRVCKCLRVWVLYNRVTMNVFVCVRMYVFRLNHNDNLELHEMPAVTATNNKNNNNNDISLPIHLLYVDLCRQLINLSLFPSIYLFLFACHQHQIKMWDWRNCPHIAIQYLALVITWRMRFDVCW